MKTLLILRHAKSSWDSGALSDHQRPLNKRGLRTAPRMGQLLADLALLPDRIFCSTAVRARQTAELLVPASGYQGEIEFRDDLYLAPSWQLRETLRELPDACAWVMIIGHNPGLEEFLQELTGEEEHLPTAALAQVELNIPNWESLQPSTRGKLLGLWRPKELDT